MANGIFIIFDKINEMPMPNKVPNDPPTKVSNIASIKN